MKTLYFTLCSNNYLPFAFSLEKSLRCNCPDIQFIIGLVDLKDEKINYDEVSQSLILPCFDLGYQEFDDMLTRYNVIEFNTAVKPFYFEYLFEKFKDVDAIYYLDPDLYFYQSPSLMDTYWGVNEIMLTPNQISLPNKTTTGELASLRHGINNLGFIGIKRGVQGVGLISWWKERLTNYCKIDKCKGIFVDQKWIDLAPLYFDQIKSIKNFGWNMAWWNFSERELILKGNTYYVNSTEWPLLFFHFSGFKPGNKNATERLEKREFEILDNSILQKFFADYAEKLRQNDYDYLSKLKPKLKFYQEPSKKKHRFGRFIKSKFNNLIFRIFKV
ncbi:hypothetical protein MM239_04520 [Belliella sp. DSM 111904]|uniref:Glycosyl transferase n=1 Tax=Belliella filtrata TaxID=2923435 RepID=A0ABS9UWW5_9BACT|nr:hypothetical protein [Belliella filtrata]MCH7408648.1 hypothetical protein [Belliella filtrata]